ncbi:flagellar hook-basal body complex protein FliE [Noviherbaspirillum denitrificans]|uniref:Flagellar hook-basal body complex protein FliE n=1 Tax=Noviherbaspirillum denitrificans TaxID=1968433 RepID=A0A254TL34_9BURK|nr:flagellar hook-basal body complex protein FliE [Noviherbaspirillum denitrificans]OWW21323.1 flagellar hook-basal body protein FliE [Noviherbaspirillum denitrificans]
MKTGMIDSSKIEAMIAQLRAAATRPDGPVNPIQGEKAAPKVDFGSALKSALDQVNTAQNKSEELAKKFVLGDDSVSLSDVMINSQKANIAFQATIQVRNKLVSAYHDIMNMSV